MLEQSLPTECSIGGLYESSVQHLSHIFHHKVQRVTYHMQQYETCIEFCISQLLINAMYSARFNYTIYYLYYTMIHIAYCPN